MRPQGHQPALSMLPLWDVPTPAYPGWYTLSTSLGSPRNEEFSSHICYVGHLVVPTLDKSEAVERTLLGRERSPPSSAKTLGHLPHPSLLVASQSSAARE